MKKDGKMLIKIIVALRQKTGQEYISVIPSKREGADTRGDLFH